MAASRGRKTKSVVQRLQLFPRIVTAPRRRWLEIVGGHFAIIVLDEGGWRRSDVTSKISSDFPTTVVWLASVTRRIWCRLEASQSQSWRAWPRPCFKARLPPFTCWRLSHCCLSPSGAGSQTPLTASQPWRPSPAATSSCQARGWKGSLKGF